MCLKSAHFMIYKDSDLFLLLRCLTGVCMFVCVCVHVCCGLLWIHALPKHPLHILCWHPVIATM